MAEILHELQLHTFAVYLLSVLRLPITKCILFTRSGHTVQFFHFFIIVLLECCRIRPKGVLMETYANQNTRLFIFALYTTTYA